MPAYRSLHNSASRTAARIRRHWQLYLVLLLPFLYFVVFHYVPMFGLTLAFKDYSVSKGILGSPWAGLKFVRMFMSSPSFFQIIGNTLSISLSQLIFSFPLPIILAISLEQCGNKFYKKTVQMVTYAPYFISTVVMVAIVAQFLSPTTGAVNMAMSALGFEEKNFMGIPAYFRPVYVASGIWQFTGFNAIMYLAALASIDGELHEAAVMDGASRLQRIWHIDLPGIQPTIVILFILNVGKIMSVGFEKVYLMQNDMNLIVSELLSTYVYRVGLVSMNFSFSTAAGLFNSLVNCILIVTAQFVAKRLTGTGLI